ncbi:hypothetical protein AC579_6770 [Pseudocercospora musae]|uniref:Uncharacterized protein n=1 Tax=Pseudocercospora musae TaxID=113226 RepID=A0A139I3H0_9PEZI|nr:hypothetical protein AC579_6770 [Pseudocercospora musae]
MTYGEAVEIWRSSTSVSAFKRSRANGEQISTNFGVQKEDALSKRRSLPRAPFLAQPHHHHHHHRRVEVRSIDGDNNLWSVHEATGPPRERLYQLNSGLMDPRCYAEGELSLSLIYRAYPRVPIPLCPDIELGNFTAATVSTSDDTPTGPRLQAFLSSVQWHSRVTNSTSCSDAGIGYGFHLLHARQAPMSTAVDAFFGFGRIAGRCIPRPRPGQKEQCHDGQYGGTKEKRDNAPLAGGCAPSMYAHVNCVFTGKCVQHSLCLHALGESFDVKLAVIELHSEVVDVLIALSNSDHVYSLGWDGNGMKDPWPRVFWLQDLDYDTDYTNSRRLPKIGKPRAVRMLELICSLRLAGTTGMKSIVEDQFVELFSNRAQL